MLQNLDSSSTTSNNSQHILVINSLILYWFFDDNIYIYICTYIYKKIEDFWRSSEHKSSTILWILWWIISYWKHSITKKKKTPFKNVQILPEWQCNSEKLYSSSEKTTLILWRGWYSFFSKLLVHIKKTVFQI